MNLKDNKKVSFPVPCGKCPECVSKRTSQWSFRLRKQAEVSTSAYFITLTYDTEHVPITKNGFMTLKTEDLVEFFKALRKKHTEKLKYYVVGEYGTDYKRPHYHLILFNADIEIVDKIWYKGHIYVGEVNGASIGYTLKYMIKDSIIPMHKNDDRLPEFGRMSKGLGENYITPETIRYHKEKRCILERQHMVIDGKKVSMPRYYKDKIYDEYDKLILQHNARQMQLKKDEIESQVDQQRRVESHKAQFKKMFGNKYKDKYI